MSIPRLAILALVGIAVLRCAGSQGEIETKFQEDFISLNEDIWQKADWYNGAPFGCVFQQQQVSSQNGFLQIVLSQGSSQPPYDCGSLASRAKFGYGKFYVRMKPVKSSGTVSSFFIYTGPVEGTIHDEIDIEFLGKNTQEVQFNYYSNGQGGHEKKVALGFDASADFHDYAIEWRNGSIQWYVDGVLKHEVSSADVPKTPGKIMINLWNSTGVDSWTGPFENSGLPLTAWYDSLQYFSY